MTISGSTSVMTNFAFTHPFIEVARGCHQIIWRQAMSVNTVSFAGVHDLDANATQTILFAGDGFQVDRVNAMANPTQMVKNQFIGNGTHEQFIHQAMDQISLFDSSAIGMPEGGRPVSRVVSVTPPEPTRRVQHTCIRAQHNFAEQASQQFAIHWQSVFARALWSRFHLTCFWLRQAWTWFVAVAYSLIPFSGTQPPTFSAYTSTEPLPSGYEVISKQRMAVKAMCFAHILGRNASTTSHIDSLGNGLQMNGINTNGIATQMVNHQLIRDDLYKQLVEQAMCGKRVVNAALKHIKGFAISILAHVSDPLPTRVRFVKMFGGNLNVPEKTGQKFLVNRQFVRIKDSHFANTSKRWIRDLARPVDVFIAHLRAVCIVLNMEGSIH